ncbi:hypothetical protein [Streptomyces sp. NPDC006140]
MNPWPTNYSPSDHTSTCTGTLTFDPQAATVTASSDGYFRYSVDVR